MIGALVYSSVLEYIEKLVLVPSGSLAYSYNVYILFSMLPKDQLNFLAMPECILSA
jgi:hypothetical protein